MTHTPAELRALLAKATSGERVKYITEDWPPGWIGLRGLQDTPALADTHVAIYGRYDDEEGMADLECDAALHNAAPELLDLAERTLKAEESASLSTEKITELQGALRQALDDYDRAECRAKKAEEQRDETNHLCDAQSNLLANINDTLRVRGYEGQFKTDERVIALAQDRDAALALATAAEERVKNLEEVVRELLQSQLHFDYCRAMYQEDGGIEAQLADDVGKASCRRADAIEAAEALLP